MPFFIIDTRLTHTAAPANLDVGGMSAWVHDHAYATHDEAQRMLRQLLEWDAERREDLLRRLPAESRLERLRWPSKMERAIVEAADAAAALPLAEAEAYRRLGQSVPTTYQYFAMAMFSVFRGTELVDKHVEVIAGPCASHEELGDVENSLTARAPVRAGMSGAQANQPASEGIEHPSVSRTYTIKAADREHALRGEGITASDIIDAADLVYLSDA